eukprot:6310416-Amphidinium_carterae.1
MWKLLVAGSCIVAGQAEFQFQAVSLVGDKALSSTKNLSTKLCLRQQGVNFSMCLPVTWRRRHEDTKLMRALIDEFVEGCTGQGLGSSSSL